MASFRSIATASSENQLTVTVAKPSGLTAGDFLVAFLCTTGNSGDTSWSTPTDWTSVEEIRNVGAIISECFVKVADSGDVAASNFTFTHPDASLQTHSCVLYAISGTFTDSSNITDVSSDIGTEATDDDPVFTPGVTPNSANSLLVMYTAGRVTNSGTSNIGSYAITTSNPTWTERADFGVSADEDQRVGTATATRTEITATGDFSVDYNSSGNLDTNGCVGMLLTISDTANATGTAEFLTVDPTFFSPNGTASTTGTADFHEVSPTFFDPQGKAINDNRWTDQKKPETPTWTDKKKYE